MRGRRLLAVMLGSQIVVGGGSSPVLRSPSLPLVPAQPAVTHAAPRGRRAGTWTAGYGVIERKAVHVAPAAGGVELIALVQQTWPERFATPSAARRACRRSIVVVDGAVGRCGDYVEGEVVLELLGRVQAPAPGEGRRGTATPRVKVVLEDDQMAIVVKPAGIPVAGGVEHNPLNLRTMLTASLQPSRSGEPLWRPQHVHRLDAPTSGLVVVAKSRATLTALSRAFAERRVRKTYRAVIAGVACPHEGDELRVVDTPLSGQSARTEWRLLRRFASRRYGEVALVELYPHTGRNHQLRRHMASLGHPIVGDVKYWLASLPEQRSQPLCLCATALAMQHPLSGEEVCVHVEQPDTFDAFCAEEQRWADASSALEDECERVANAVHPSAEQPDDRRVPDADPSVWEAAVG